MEELLDLKRRLEQERPADWRELPDIALYMDQIISYLPRQLIHFDDSEELTSAMVNNYIKEGLVPRAAGKRYGPIHLGYLTAVCALKKVLSVRDMGILIAAGEARDKTPEELYQYFCAALDRALTDTASSIDPAAQREDLARMALDLALRSYAPGCWTSSSLRRRSTGPKEKGDGKCSASGGACALWYDDTIKEVVQCLIM